MRRLLLALITAGALSLGIAGLASAAPDTHACNTPGLGALQAAFLNAAPCADHAP